MDRAYAVLEVKSVDVDARIIEGFATTPTTDRNGDIVDPAGAEFTLPMPLLWQHDVTPARRRSHRRHGHARRDPHHRAIRHGRRARHAARSARRGVAERQGAAGARAVDRVQAARDRAAAQPAAITSSGGCGPKCSAVTIPMNIAATITSIKSAVGDVPPSPTCRSADHATDLQRTDRRARSDPQHGAGQHGRPDGEPPTTAARSTPNRPRSTTAMPRRSRRSTRTSAACASWSR